ncbi:MAG: metal ABC transporter ATP-binding protein [bacterium]|jgi:ABC-type Mn2+/Zn2+ transport system ATPase subunit|nr:metal ABC transporter ATP-binding protein [bacterium]
MRNEPRIEPKQEPSRIILHALKTEIERSAPAVFIQNVVVYRQTKPVLRNVNLCLDSGQCLGILGPAGAGKTTLLEAVLGQIRTREGVIEIFGTPVRKTNFRQLGLGYVAEQHPHPTAFPITALDVILQGLQSGRGVLHFTPKEEVLFARYLLSELKMEQAQDQLFYTLSRGEQQRLLIARALACQPRLLLLDNPIQGLDPAGVKQIQELLKSIQKQYRTAILLTSRDARFAAELCDTLVCLNGAVYWTGPAKELTPAQVKQVFQCDVYFRNPYFRPKPKYGHPKNPNHPTGSGADRRTLR